jgi:predicted secreted acid phosphatase
MVSPSTPKGKTRIDVYLSSDRERRFKEEVFKRKGMKKGNISEAVDEAILLWINAEPSKTIRRKEE